MYGGAHLLYGASTQDNVIQQGFAIVSQSIYNL